MWLLSIWKGVLPAVEGSWHHNCSPFELGRAAGWRRRFSGQSKWWHQEENLEQKLENLKWKMNMFIVCVVCVVLGCVPMYDVIPNAWIEWMKLDVQCNWMNEWMDGWNLVSKFVMCRCWMQLKWWVNIVTMQLKFVQICCHLWMWGLECFIP